MSQDQGKVQAKNRVDCNTSAQRQRGTSINDYSSGDNSRTHDHGGLDNSGNLKLLYNPGCHVDWCTSEAATGIGDGFTLSLSGLLNSLGGVAAEDSELVGPCSLVHCLLFVSSKRLSSSLTAFSPPQ